MNNHVNISSVPINSGVYLISDKNNTIIYIGKAINLKNRVKSYFQSGEKTEKVKKIEANARKIDYIVTDNEKEALILESNLIKKFKPKYNILLKEDRGLAYLKVTIKDKYPKLVNCNVRINDGSKYYGPYQSRSAMYEIKSLVENIFPVKSCDVPVYKDRPCLYYHLKKCLAPCISWVSPEEHQQMIKEVCLFLDGKFNTFLYKLNKDMQESAENLDFESAAKLRDLIKRLKSFIDKQIIISKPNTEYDVIGTLFDDDIMYCEVFQIRDGKLIGKLNFNYQISEADEFISAFITNYYEKTNNIPSEIILEKKPEDYKILEEWLSEKKNKKVEIVEPQKGYKKSLLDLTIKNVVIYMEQLKSDLKFQVSKKGALELKKYLNLEDIPKKIEGFDISHTQGTNTVASMVVFENGKPKKSEYRKFKINYSEGEPNDFLSMYEVIYRRYKRVIEEELEQPDLILIDGGKGQLSSALQALNDLNYPYKAIISIAKRIEEVFLPNESEAIIIPEDSLALKLLQFVRDESHRFAITFHRSLRTKAMLSSILDNIDGIGTKRKKFLLETFSSIETLNQTSLEDLVLIGKLPQKVAENLFNKLKE